MRWLLAGLAFALAVGLAIGTAAIRADNASLRRALDRDYVGVRDCQIELRRLQVLAQAQGAPEKLAALVRAQVRRYQDQQAAAAAAAVAP